MTRPILLVILLLAPCIVSYAQGVRLMLENCTLDSTTDKKIRRSLNFQIQFFSQIFKERPIEHFQARIFPTKLAFKEYQKSHSDLEGLENALAYYTPDRKEMVLHMEVNDFPETFAHELCHALQHYYTKDTTAMGVKWITEGLAMLMEDFVVTDSTYFLAGNVQQKADDAIRLFNKGLTFESALNRWNGYDDYIMSWTAIYYLYSTSRPVLIDLIRQLWTNFDSSYMELYPGGPELLGIDSRSWFLNWIPAQHSGSKP